MGNKNLKSMVRGAYDVQKLRIQIGNRIVANFKSKLGQEPGHKEDEIDAEGRMILQNIRLHFRRITDGVTGLPRQKTFKGDEVISDYTELCLIAQYLELENNEKDPFSRLKSVLMEYDVYTQFLQDVKGIGPAMAGVIISEIDIAMAKYPSSLWAYAGLDVAGDGKARSRRKEHLREYEYKNKDGEIKKKKGITFNPFLKTKLIGVLATSFLRAGDNHYSRIYNNYKGRLVNHPSHSEKTKKHRHNMALRYMVFLVDLYTVWREMEGLPVSVPYSEGKLGIRHDSEE